ncbi:phage tail protein [Sphingobacterium paramultivorum]|uniref:phage tail protein n=1 Tax=Sphingobacterium paramultivorum TaxID=2886510 RepID=UPI00129CE752|nr:phage tail protein [Sphingobacterium paramultivorum]
MNTLQLYRQGAPTVIVPLDENTVYFDECMGRFDIQCQFFSPTVLDIKVDDYIIYNGVRYTINVPYQITRSAVIQYNITFEHPSYWLKDITFKHLGAIEFSFFGAPQTFVQLIVDCMNVDDSGWMVGTCDVADEKLIDFFADSQGYSCKGALQKIAEDLELEFWFSGDGKTINLTKQAGMQTNIGFSYGRTKGLYSVERGILDTPLYNRIYGFGGTKNIPSDYRNKAKRLTFNTGMIERPLATGERRRETSVVMDDIFPERTGTLTAVSADWLSLTDTSLDFDLNGNLIDGETAKVVFKTGELGGKEFEISSYNNSTKTIRIKTNTEQDGYVTPNATFSPNIGDKYTLIGIKQPQSYITDAENRLFKEVEKSFKTLTRPPYRVEIDEKYMRENAFTLKSGDRVRLKDDKLGIDDMIRVTSVSFPLVNPNQCTVVISDQITYTQETQNVIDTGKVKEEVKTVNRKKAEEQRRQALRMRQLQGKIFDPEGDYFDPANIKPLSIETLMLSVGAKSQNFYLDGVRIIPNVGDDPNAIQITAGKLIHREVQIEGLGYIWELGGLSTSGLDPAKSYYLSAKCSRTQLTGQWVLSETPINTEAEAGYYHFNCGLLYNVLEGRRDYAFTNGMTYINGDTIRTGKIGAEFIDVIGLFAQIITVGSDGFVNAGISGVTDRDDKSIRFWAGANEEDRYEAPFQVLDNGYFKSTSGEIGKLRIMPEGIYYGSPDDTMSNLYFNPSKLIYRTNMDEGEGETGVKFKKSLIINVDPISQLGMQIASNYFSSPSGVSAPNVALALIASGSPNSNNDIALQIDGNIRTPNGNGLNRRIVIDGGSSRFYHILVQSGLIVNFAQTTNSDNPFNN